MNHGLQAVGRNGLTIGIRRTTIIGLEKTEINTTVIPVLKKQFVTFKFHCPRMFKNKKTILF